MRQAAREVRGRSARGDQGCLLQWAEGAPSIAGLVKMPRKDHFTPWGFIDLCDLSLARPLAALNDHGSAVNVIARKDMFHAFASDRVESIHELFFGTEQTFVRAARRQGQANSHGTVCMALDFWLHGPFMNERYEKYSYGFYIYF